MLIILFFILFSFPFSCCSIPHHQLTLIMSLSRPSRQALRLSRQLQLRPSSLSISISSTPSSQASRVSRRSAATLTPPHQAGAISRLPTNVDPSSPEFKDNEAQMADITARLQSLTKTIQQGGSQKARDKHIARNKMLPRDRVAALIDPGTTFLELSPMAGYELYPEAEVPAGGIITGVGVVEGVTCVIVANDSTVKGGTYYPITVKKHLRAQAVAQENKLP